MKKTPFTRMRAISDSDLTGALVNHAQTLRGMSVALSMVLRERRLLLVWVVVVTLVLVKLAVWG